MEFCICPDGCVTWYVFYKTRLGLYFGKMLCVQASTVDSMLHMEYYVRVLRRERRPRLDQHVRKNTIKRVITIPTVSWCILNNTAMFQL